MLSLLFFFKGKGILKATLSEIKSEKIFKGFQMKVFLREDIEKVGMAGEIINVSEGYARNFLFPRKLAIVVTPKNESFYAKRIKILDHHKEVVASKTSMLAERIGSLELSLKKKMHDDGKLYGAVNRSEIVDLLAAKGVSVSKNQIEFEKAIKGKGRYPVIVKLSSRLKPKITLNISEEK